MFRYNISNPYDLKGQFRTSSRSQFPSENVKLNITPGENKNGK